jgi:hypothetical protein
MTEQIDAAGAARGKKDKQPFYCAGFFGSGKTSKENCEGVYLNT